MSGWLETIKMSFRTESTPNLSGIGMTSQRTRERLLGRLMDQGITSMEVLDVIRSTPRHIFLDEALSHRAYEDVALPIAFLSGPLTNVLEIGTGCGYQTSILARLAKRVTTVERIKPLLDKARKNLRLLGLRNIDFRHGDGSLGFKRSGPFDAIITTAAPQQIPHELLFQLNDGGRLIIPVGGDVQQLQLITRRGEDFQCDKLEDVKFVPLLVGQVQN
jgi:protein-L-isoaspartate(D-aspartate) O-methyltransferase